MRLSSNKLFSLSCLFCAQCMMASTIVRADVPSSSNSSDTGSPNQSSSAQSSPDHKFIAVGQIARPAMPGNTNIRPTTGTPGQVPFPEKPEDLFPLAKPETAKPEGAGQSVEDLTKPMN